MSAAWALVIMTLVLLLFLLLLLLLASPSHWGAGLTADSRPE